MKIYGDPVTTMQCASVMMDAYNYAREKALLEFGYNPYPPEHDEAMRMAISKIARIASGKFKPDNYRDTGNYAKIAQMCKIAEVKRIKDNVNTR